MENQPIVINGNNEGRWRKWLYNEITLLIAVVGIIFGTINWVQVPQKENAGEVEALKDQVVQYKQESIKDKELFDQLVKTQQNDLHTLEGDVKTQGETLNRIENNIIKLQTILEERIPIRKQ